MATCTMFWRTCRRFVDARWRCDPASGRPHRRSPACQTLALAFSLGAAVVAQDNWPTYHGDFSGQRHSKLTQITPGNVHQLSLVWAFQTGQTQQIKSTPILVNGVIYIPAP